MLIKEYILRKEKLVSFITNFFIPNLFSECFGQLRHILWSFIWVEHPIVLGIPLKVYKHMASVVNFSLTFTQRSKFPCQYSALNGYRLFQFWDLNRDLSLFLTIYRELQRRTSCCNSIDLREYQNTVGSFHVGSSGYGRRVHNLVQRICGPYCSFCIHVQVFGIF